MPSSRQATACAIEMVGAAVVGDELLDGDAVAAVELDRAAQERDRGGGFLVGEDFGVGQACRVVDRDMHALPADQFAVDAGSVSLLGGVSLVAATSTWFSFGRGIGPIFVGGLNVNPPGKRRLLIWKAGVVTEWLLAPARSLRFTLTAT